MEFLESAGAIFEGFWQSFLEAGIWKLLACAAVILLALILKGFIGKFVFRLIKKKTGYTDGKKSVIGAVLDTIDRPIQLLVITAALYICANILGIGGTLSDVTSQIVDTLIIISVFWVLYNVADYVKTAIGKVTRLTEIRLDSIAAAYIATVLKCVVFVFGAICVLNVWISDVAGLVAGLSIGAVAVTLATQDIAANLVGSIAVMLDRPFDIGDYIEVGAIAGNVESMGMRSTRIRTKDRALVAVPNKTMSSANIINRTKADWRAVWCEIYVEYTTAIDKLREFTKDIGVVIGEAEDVKKDSIKVHITGFDDSLIHIAVSFSVIADSDDKADEVRGSINLAALDAAAKNGVTVKKIH